MSFTIDQLFSASSTMGDALSGRIDAERVGLVGHSLGGATAIAVTRLPCCTDKRIDAAVTVAPVEGVLDPLLHESARSDGPPTLVINGGSDPLVNPEASRAFYQEIAPPHVFLLIPGAQHSDLIENVGMPAPYVATTERASIAFFDAYLGGDRAALAAAIDDLRAEGDTVLAE